MRGGRKSERKIRVRVPMISLGLILGLVSASVAVLSCASHSGRLARERKMNRESLPDLVRNLADRVAFALEPPAELARLFGVVETENSSWISVVPSDPRFRQVLVTMRPDTGLLGNVELILAEPGSIRSEELAALWGPPRIPPGLAIGRTTLIFYPPFPPGAPYRAIVTIQTDGDEDGPGISVQVIRDTQ